MLGNVQYGFTKRKSCFTKLIAVCEEVTSLMGKRRAVAITYLDFSKTSNSVSYSTLKDKLMKSTDGLGKWTARWTEDQLS